MKLSELVDLEVRFAADRELDPKQLRQRDEHIGTRILTGHTGSLPRHEIFRRWLSALRDDDSPTVGEQIEAGYRLFGISMGVVALLLGAGAARAVLAYDGSQPVNVVHFLAVFVAAQLVLVGVAIFAMAPHGLGHAFGPLQEIIRLVTYRRSRAHGRRLWPHARPAGLARMSALGAVYGRVERWLLLSLTQRTAFFFNVGALFTCLYLITFTDLAFAWSTTLDIDPETMTRILHAIAFPWRWLEAAVPAPELVTASRYFRNGAGYDPRTLKDWWAFLLAALVTYGLLPRLFMWTFAAWHARRLRALLTLDHGDAQIAYERLTRGTHGWSGRDVACDERGSVPARGRTQPLAGLPPLPSAGDCTVVCWADVPLSRDDSAKLVEHRFGWRAKAHYESGGRDRAVENDALVEALAGEPADRPVIVLAESWEAPSRALTGFLEALRKGVGSRRTVVVGLLDARDGSWGTPMPDDREVWETVVARLADPYLRVESVIDE